MVCYFCKQEGCGALCLYKPLVLKGDAAKDFLAAMEERERRGNTPEEKAFMDECVKIYERSRAQMKA
jgi:hypothetical protein